MKTFAQFIRESPHETVQPISVNSYLRNTPDVSWQPRIQSIIALVRAGGIVPTYSQEVPIGTLIPTQETVSQPKVQSMISKTDLPLGLVLVKDGQNYLLDGHHRACADAIQGLLTTSANVITADQLP